MTTMNGASSPKSISSSFLHSLARWEILLLLGTGALAVVLHQSLRLPLGLPSRHGIEWMALLVLARASSRQRGAGSLASVGAAATSLLPVWGFDDPYVWLTYLLPGLVMDAAFTLLPRLEGKLWFLVLLGGLAHATKPLARWVISLANGWAYGSLLFGLAYPLATHILFGAVGGLLGALIVLGGHRLAHKS